MNSEVAMPECMFSGLVIPSGEVIVTGAWLGSLS